MKNLFVVSDIHGYYKQFEKILEFWNTEDTLVVLGDLIDRGPESLQVIEKVIELKYAYCDNVVFCKGNHEEMLLNFLENPLGKQEQYYINGGQQTMQSLLAKLPNEAADLPVVQQAMLIKEKFRPQLEFLRNGLFHKIIGNVLLTHAGFNSQFTSLDETSASDFIRIRKHYLQENHTPYINVFGHTPVSYIHESNDVWLSEDRRYIAIDGGCYMSGRLNAVLLSQAGELLDVYKVNL
ncbi:metallophosphoesterase family protein [Solibacillus silvestris]|uniref:metallophosphoesterase family protein n=1 Tax=Solibacillus silvestris TaxID=76853 RepID=UPI003F7CD403